MIRFTYLVHGEGPVSGTAKLAFTKEHRGPVIFWNITCAVTSPVRTVTSDPGSGRGEKDEFTTDEAMSSHR